MLGIIFLCEGQNSTCSYWQQCVAASFKADLENALKSCPNSYDSFEQCFSSKLNEYAPKKQSGWEGIINRTWISF